MLKRMLVVGAIAASAVLMPGAARAQGGYYSEIVRACNYWGCNPDYVYGVMLCEDPTLDPGAVSAAINPGTGTHDYGLFQISTLWGGQYMSSSEQIWFAAEHLTKGDIWWVCS